MASGETNNPEISGLRAAFETFNEVSGQLRHAYGDLQGQVSRLRAQLERANRARAAEARRTAELAERLSSLLEALPGAVVMLDEQGVVREINTAACNFLGQPLEGHEWPLICRRAFLPDTDEQGDLTLQDGRKVTLAQQSIEPARGHVLLLTDVTENRKLQELLTRHRRLAAMGEMAAALAHQIRTPLSAALLYNSNAARGDLDPARRSELLDKSTQCLHNLEQLISDMLSFARGTGHDEAEFAVGDLLADTETALHPVLRGEQQVRLRQPACSVRIQGNREALAGALLNLVTNALQHAGREARVDVTVLACGLTTEIRVADNGPGVPAADRNRIFDPFFTSRPDGTGLGLAVVRSVARAHDGDVELEEDGQPGATFVLRLPVSAEHAAVPADETRETIISTTEDVAA